jgi:hypothetical protein
MSIRERRATYASLWALALAFGWIEASAVVYLADISGRNVPVQASTASGLPVPLASLPNRLVAVEAAREACTLVLLAAVGWMAGRRSADRAGAFLLAFGVWDLTYYASLRAMLGWPDSVNAWDVLFLIPAPWVAPVWAPATVAILFVLAGTYLFWTSDRERSYRWSDGAVLATSVALMLTAFLARSSAAVEHRAPERFPVWLFGTGVVLGTAWFLRLERGRARRVQRFRPARIRSMKTPERGHHETT